MCPAAPTREAAVPAHPMTTRSIRQNRGFGYVPATPLRYGVARRQRRRRYLARRRVPAQNSSRAANRTSRC